MWRHEFQPRIKMIVTYYRYQQNRTGDLRSNPYKGNVVGLRRQSISKEKTKSQLESIRFWTEDYPPGLTISWTLNAINQLAVWDQQPLNTEHIDNIWRRKFRIRSNWRAASWCFRTLITGLRESRVSNFLYLYLLKTRARRYGELYQSSNMFFLMIVQHPCNDLQTLLRWNLDISRYICFTNIATSSQKHYDIIVKKRT